MKKLAKTLTLILVLILSMPLGVFAATVDTAQIDTAAKGSLTIYKYDITNAEKDGAWNSSYVSTGVYDQKVNDVLGAGIREGDVDSKSDLGNGDESYGYALAGVEFTYVRIADILQYSDPAAGDAIGSHIEVLYGIDTVKGSAFLRAIGLTDGKNRYEPADSMNSDYYYYQSDVLITALEKALAANSTTVKNALESYAAANGGVAMPLTNAYGKTQASNLPLGLYLVVETKVPEMVVSTTDPFLVSLPMTSINGTNATDGGERWIYDVTVYPKNLTGIPSLEKTLRERKEDTGKNNGTTAITDGYAHTGSASAGDIIDYQLISTLPSITSEATYLTAYTFVDTIGSGLTYSKNDVVLAWYTDAACTTPITTWRETDGKFTVSYGTAEAGSVMTIQMTAAGLAEINASNTVYTESSMVNSGYSDCTLRITYTAVVDSDKSLVTGDSGNGNSIVLTWKRSSTSYYDTLVDDSHLYTYGLDLTKRFSDGKGNFSNVEFIVHNDTDGYYVKAALNETEGIYYVVDHVDAEAEATRFVPVESNGESGKVIIKGMEDDEYTVTEVRTDSGYTLLKNSIKVIITQSKSNLCGIYATDAAGLIQNDPRYAQSIIDEAVANGYIKTDGNLADILNNLPQTHLEHDTLTVTANVDSKDVTMLESGSSANSLVPMTVVNTSGFRLPETGEIGTWIITSVGILLMAAAVVVAIVVLCKNKKKSK